MLYTNPENDHTTVHVRSIYKVEEGAEGAEGAEADGEDISKPGAKFVI